MGTGEPIASRIGFARKARIHVETGGKEILNFERFDTFARAVHNQPVAASFEADACLPIKLFDGCRSEQIPNTLLIIAAEQVLSGKLRVVCKVDVLVSEHVANLVIPVFRSQREIRQVEAFRPEADGRLVVRSGVLAAAGCVTIIENCNFRFTAFAA